MKVTLTVNVARLNEIAAFSKWKNFRAELALRAKISTSYVNQLFCGRVPGPKVRIRICRALNIDEGELFRVSEAVGEVA